MLDFQPFPKIARLVRECVATEKIDGTNAQIYIPDDDGPMLVGSRTRWITPDDDNFGFARWAFEHADELRALGPGSHFGEWWGAGIQRRYGLTEKRFSLFNTARWGDRKSAPCVKCGADDTTWSPAVCVQCNKVRLVEPSARPSCCDVVPVLARGIGIDEVAALALDRLRADGSHAAPGFMKPEGIVIYHTSSRGLFKVTLDGDGHKGSK